MIQLIPRRKHQWKAFDAKVIKICPVYGLLTLQVTFYCERCFELKQDISSLYPEDHTHLDKLDSGIRYHSSRAS